MTGAREGGGLFLSERPVPVDYKQHAVDRYLKLAEYLECGFTSWKGSISLFESDKILINQLLSTDGFGKGPVIAINPMARWKTKLWELERFAALADRLRDELSCQIVFTGSKHDRAIIEDISGMMKNKPINLTGQTTLKKTGILVYQVQGSCHYRYRSNAYCCCHGVSGGRSVWPHGFPADWPLWSRA